MPTDQPESQNSESQNSESHNGRPDNSTRVLVIGTAVVALLGLGWFFLSHFVMETGTGDAIGEALGVMLGVLVLLSVVGAVRGNHG